MKLEELQDEMELDSIIERDNLDNESLKIPKIHSKWLKYYSAEKRILNKLKLELRSLVHFKTEYYSGKSDAQVYKEKPFHLKLIRADVDKYVENDPDVIAICSDVDIQEEKIYLIQEFIKGVNQRSFNIRSAIDFMKWTGGA
jgi:hypothetical protein